MEPTPEPPWTCPRCQSVEAERLAWQLPPGSSLAVAHLPPPGPDVRCRVCSVAVPLEEQERLRAQVQTQLLERIAAALERDWHEPGPVPKVEPAITLTLGETQGLLGCGRTRVFELLRQGKLTGKRLGRERRILRESVERLLADVGESWRTDPPPRRRKAPVRGEQARSDEPDEVARKIEKLRP